MQARIRSGRNFHRPHTPLAERLERLTRFSEISAGSLIAALVTMTLGLGAWMVGLQSEHVPLTTAGMCVTATPFLVLRPSWALLVATAILSGVWLSGSL